MIASEQNEIFLTVDKKIFLENEQGQFLPGFFKLLTVVDK